MRQPPLDPDAADEAPVADILTPYDQEHLDDRFHETHHIGGDVKVSCALCHGYIHRPRPYSAYDSKHGSGRLVTYLRLLDAEFDRADWKEAARTILHIDPDREPARARLSWESHLRRAYWMTKEGYRHLPRLSQLH
jgi:hypothetical protein